MDLGAKTKYAMTAAFVEREWCRTWQAVVFYGIAKPVKMPIASRLRAHRSERAVKGVRHAAKRALADFSYGSSARKSVGYRG